MLWSSSSGIDSRMKKLTDRQAEILAFIIEEQERKGKMPTLTEIASNFNFTPAAAHYTISALASKGYIIREKGGHRAIVLPSSERAVRENISIPLFKEEPSPIEIIRDPGNHLFISREEKPEKPISFTVTSLSMKNAGILPGDIAILDMNTSKLKDGDIVLAGFDDSNDKMELRKYRKTPFFVQLEPENDIMGIIKSADIKVFAILKAIRRYY